MTMKSTGDNAFTATTPYGLRDEATYAGALSFLRRPYTRDLADADIAVTGIPFDLATTNRPGARLGPRAVRAASAQLSWGPPWPWGFDPTKRLAVVDAGDCALDHGRPADIPACIERHAADILDAGASMLSIGGDHYVTLPILRAHAARHGPLALVHFDAHSDTWSDEDGRIDHGTMFWHAVREGIVDVARSVQIGIRTHNEDRLGFTWLDAAWVHQHGPAAAAKETRRIVGDARAYLTFDIDCLDPGFRSGDGNPGDGRTVDASGAKHRSRPGRNRLRGDGHRRSGSGLRRGRQHRTGGRQHRPRLSLRARKVAAGCRLRPRACPVTPSAHPTGQGAADDRSDWRSVIRQPEAGGMAVSRGYEPQPRREIFRVEFGHAAPVGITVRPNSPPHRPSFRTASPPRQRSRVRVC